MKLMITGASGFIGQHLSNAMERKNNQIINISKSSGLDLAKNSLLELDNVDKVIHLASRTFIPDSFDNPETIYRDNYLSMLNVLEYCRTKSIKQLIFLSTYVYGQPEYLPIDEKHPTNIKNPYGRSKLDCERLCQTYAEDYDLSIITLRAFNIFGTKQNHKFLFPTIIKQLLDADTQQIILENLEPKRDYLYIKDLINILNYFIGSNVNNGHSIFNIGYGKSHSVSDVVNNIMNIFGIKKDIYENKSIRKNEVIDCYADITKIKNYCQWEPKYNLQEGILDMKKYYMSENCV